MRIEDVELGAKVIITGREGGCDYKENCCMDCLKGELEIGCVDLRGGNRISVQELTGRKDECDVMLSDLSLVKINWRKEL